MSSKKFPAMPFYIGDWRKDPGVRALDHESRSVWFEMLCDMWECDERGKLLINGRVPEDKITANSYGISLKKFKKIKEKILFYGVASVDEKTGCLFNRRMVRDEEIRAIRSECGKKGGNPALKDENLVEDLVKQNPNQMYETEYESEKEVKDSKDLNNKKPLKIEIEKKLLENFDEDWKSYPNGGNRQKALVYYHKSVGLNADRRRAFQEKMAAYVASVENSKYLKLGETFFNQWADLEIRATGPPGNGFNPQSHQPRL